MAASTVGITGSGPLSVTDKNGAQHFVPLSAFELGGSDLTLKTDWATQIAKQNIDAVLLPALATARFLAGELTAPPAPRVGPAILFSAKQIGPEGNGIIVAVTPDGLTDVTLVATQTLVYPGLTSGAMAQAKIGDTSGTGPVQVVPGASPDPPVAVAPTVVAASGKLDVVDAAKKTVFTLTNVTTDPVTVEVQLDGAKTFVVTVTRGPLTSTKVKLADVDKSTGDASRLVVAKTPSTGLAVPADAPVTLSGGDANVAATGVAYSS